MGASTVSGGPTTECLQGAHEALTRADAGGVENDEAVGDDNLGSICYRQVGRKYHPPSQQVQNHTHRLSSRSLFQRCLGETAIKAILGAFQGFLEVPRFSQTLHTPVPLEPLPSDQHVFGVFWDIFLCKDSSLPASYTAFVCNPDRSQVIFPTCEDCPAGLLCLAFINLGDS